MVKRNSPQNTGKNFFLFISASWVFMLASVSDFYLHITFKKKEVIPYTTYITFQLLVRIDRVNKLAECFISTDIQIHTSFNTTFKNRHFKY